MIESLSIIEPPWKWNPPDMTDKMVTAWPFMATLLAGNPDKHTQGVIMGLKTVCDSLRIEYNVDVDELAETNHLPDEKDLMQVVGSQDHVLDALLDVCPQLAQMRREMSRGQDPEFKRGVLIAFGTWYIRLGQEKLEEEAEESAGIEGTAFEIPENQKQENLDDDPDFGRDPEAPGTEEAHPSSVFTVKDAFIELAGAGLKPDITFHSGSFILTVVIPTDKICADILHLVEDAFSQLESDGPMKFVPSTLGLTTALYLSPKTKW